MLMVCIFLWSVLFYRVLTGFVLQASVVLGDSMLPAMRDGERHFIHRWFYLLLDPQRGDVVAIALPGYEDMSVKRIVGMPLDRVRIVDGKVSINGRELQENYLRRGSVTKGGALHEHEHRVAEGCYFVLGDNRSVSIDSRHFGAVPRRALVGRILSE